MEHTRLQVCFSSVLRFLLLSFLVVAVFNLPFLGSYAIGSCINGRLRHQFQSGNNSVELAKTNRITYDMMIWHFFATVSVTPVLIHKSKDLSKKILGLMKFSDKKVKFGSSVIGIALIPVLVPPVDNATHYIMNKYFRTAEEQKPYEWHGLYSSLNKEH